MDLEEGKKEKGKEKKRKEKKTNEEEWIGFSPVAKRQKLPVPNVFCFHFSK